jgi:hypothetical protein
VAVELDRLPNDVPKYVVTDYPGVAGDLHWLVQPIVFITNTAAAAQQERRNLHYVTVPELRARGVANEFSLYVLVDQASSAGAWLQEQAPTAEVRVVPHTWQQMQDLSH